jgi:rhamnogalacturonan II specific xylosyltransferase
VRDLITEKIGLSNKDSVAGIENDWAILLTFNNAFYELFLNWMWYFERLFLHLKVIAIAEDELAYSRLQEFKSSFSGLEIEVVRSHIISINKSVSMKNGKEDYMRLVSARPAYILHYLNRGIDVLYCDVDTIYVRDPTPYLIGDFDMWMLTTKQGQVCNSGFMAIRSNNRTINLMNKWKEKLETKLQTNQPALNMLLNTTKDIHLKRLNESLFANGPDFEHLNAEQRQNIVVVHATHSYGSSEKKERIKRWNLWYKGR